MQWATGAQSFSKLMDFALNVLLIMCTVNGSSFQHDHPWTVAASISAGWQWISRKVIADKLLTELTSFPTRGFVARGSYVNQVHCLGVFVVFVVCSTLLCVQARQPKKSSGQGRSEVFRIKGTLLEVPVRPCL